jgi:hypothetical protein
VGAGERFGAAVAAGEAGVTVVGTEVAAGEDTAGEAAAEAGGAAAALDDLSTTPPNRLRESPCGLEAAIAAE